MARYGMVRNGTVRYDMVPFYESCWLKLLVCILGKSLKSIRMVVNNLYMSCQSLFMVLIVIMYLIGN